MKIFKIIVFLLIISYTGFSQSYLQSNKGLSIELNTQSFIMERENASTEPGLNINIGLVFDDLDGDVYIELIGGYNSLNILDNTRGRYKEYFTNLDFNVGLKLNSIFNIKLGVFFLVDNTNTSQWSIGPMLSSQINFPPILNKKLQFFINGSFGGNANTTLEYEQDYTLLIKGGIGVKYELVNTLY